LASITRGVRPRAIVPCRRSGLGLVIPEDRAHRAADFAQRAGVLERLPDRRQQILVAAAGRLQLLEPAVGERLVAAGLERLEPLDLGALRRGVDAQDVLDRTSVV
jgi:hypothetical protein